MLFSRVRFFLSPRDAPRYSAKAEARVSGSNASIAALSLATLGAMEAPGRKNRKERKFHPVVCAPF